VAQPSPSLSSLQEPSLDDQPITAIPVVDRAIQVDNVNGFDFLIQIGKTDTGQKALKQQMRLTGTERWFPLIEMLLEFENYFKDVDTKFPPGVKDPPPPPPPPE